MSGRKRQVLMIMGERPDHMWSIAEVQAAATHRSRQYTAKLLRQLARSGQVQRFLVKPPGHRAADEVRYRLTGYEEIDADEAWGV